MLYACRRLLPNCRRLFPKCRRLKPICRRLLLKCRRLKPNCRRLLLKIRRLKPKSRRLLPKCRLIFHFHLLIKQNRSKFLLNCGLLVITLITLGISDVVGSYFIISQIKTRLLVNKKGMIYK